MKGVWEFKRFTSRGDHRGELVAIESLVDAPFDIKRVYYLIQTKEGVCRGLHAHQNLDQILIAIAGRCRVRVDDGFRKEEFLLDNCKMGLRITNLVWREMFDFSSDCVLLVLASDFYREKDYIRDYSRFLTLVEQQEKKPC